MNTNSDRKCLWVFGNAVQDITVEVDVDRLFREVGATEEVPISLGDDGPEIKIGACLRTHIGSQSFAVHMNINIEDLSNIDRLNLLKDSRYILKKGKDKFTLCGDIWASTDDSESSPNHEKCHSLRLPCDNLSWGGGGANVVTILRSLAPRPNIVPVKYTDIAMSLTLPKVLGDVEGVCCSIVKECPARQGKVCTVKRRATKLYLSDPLKAERITGNMAKIASAYAPDKSLEVYLASLPVEAVLHRPRRPRFRRNWVFSRFRSAYHEVNNKIILRGSPRKLSDRERSAITKLTRDHESSIGAIVLNSLKDAPLFHAAYDLFRRAHRTDPNVVGIFAMTESMAKFTDWMLKKRKKEPGKNKSFPPFILVFNETEAYNFAKIFDPKLKPFIQGDGLPDIRKFAEIALTILRQFDAAAYPRIYVTIGRHGSLGVEGMRSVIHVSSFSRRGATIYDTNGCGDAYCAAVALLEWAKRHAESAEKIGLITSGSNNPNVQEMHYFMAVATATAYCKATNRRGRVYAGDIKDLLQHTHLSSQVLLPADDLASLKPGTRPEYIDEKFRLKEPPEARFVPVTEELNILLS